MALTGQQPKWRRIYLQTSTLMYKNFLVFCKAPITTFCRAFLLPLAVTLVFSFLIHLNAISDSYDDTDYGIAKTSTPVISLGKAITSAPASRVVFVRNGIPHESLDPIVNGVLGQPEMAGIDAIYTEEPNDIFKSCKQTTYGSSDCFAAVVFTNFNETSVDYIIAVDQKLASGYGFGDYHTGDNLLTRRIFPLQWAIDSQIGNFSKVARPSTQPFAGYFGPHSFIQDQAPLTVGPFWLSLISTFVAPIFVLIIIGVVYHLATFVATERESSMSELMAAQNVTATPRILSTLLSFFILYFPGLLACSIILTQVLFKKTSDILFLFVTLLAGSSFIASSHFLASFFSKAQLAGLYTSTLVFALSLITLAAALTSKSSLPQVTALSLLFPPCTWANFIADVALREYALRQFSLKAGPYRSIEHGKLQILNGYLYVIFFVVQIIAYTIAAYWVERKLWGVTRNFDCIDANNDVALRCTSLSKTYLGKRRWYWPFSRKGVSVKAVDSLNLEVKKGSVTFLLGPNGGGKTTTLKCVAGMTNMDSGSRLEINEAGLVFGICPQSNVFWSTLTVEQHISIWRRLKLAAFNDESDVDDVLVECDLLEKAQARAGTLSGGQMRKLQLAIAFVGGSKVCCIDEASSGLADILSDHIAIVYKGKLVCEGPGTSLKAQHGDDYVIRSDSDVDGDAMVWRAPNSAQATRKLLELESLTEDSTYNVVFPTLEQVFLKVTSDTAVLDHGGDGMVGEEATDNVIDEKIFAMENENARDIDLDVGHSIGIMRQIATLFGKRYALLRQKAGWISYGINIIIPVIVAAALVKFFYKFDPLQTCAQNVQALHNGSLAESDYSSGDSLTFVPVGSPVTSSIYSRPGMPSTYLGPESAFTGAVQDALYSSIIAPLYYEVSYSDNTGYGAALDASTTLEHALSSRGFVNDTNTMIFDITNSSGTGYYSFGLYAPTPESATLFYSTGISVYDMGTQLAAFSLLTNRISNATATTGRARFSSASIRTMLHADNKVSMLALPISVLVSLSFIAAASIAIIYPAFEKNNRVRALQYCNGVSPFALWFGYLLFDMQFIIIQSVFVWGLLYTGRLAPLWYASSYLLGVFILFGIATYLGTYLLSLFTKKAAFAVAAGIHVLLFVLYVVSYVMNQSFGDETVMYSTYSALQYGLGLSSPGANLVRALFVASNSFGVLCGTYADADVSSPFAYVRYGSVYANLLVQIIFLFSALMVYEYGSADWLRRNITHRGVPSRLHYIVESEDASPAAQTEKTTSSTTTSSDILTVSRVSKYFNKTFAVENVSFSIAANQTLALLGGNGAGKTTCINMIRGEIKPNFGDIFLDGVSVARQPHKARLHIGVCPQDDAIDNLTVRQTLRFYATVKGLKNVEGNVDRILEALNITIYENLSVKALSGGTRRKLSVAIALLGNPRVLLLDEPSTGQDAGAKRILWKALQAVSANRAILLTTHSMEEAEALATNVAIMGTKMLAKGTLASLQESHGGAFSIRAVRAAGVSAVEVEERIKAAFDPSVKEYVDRAGLIAFGLPHERERLGAIMRVMEGLKGDVIQDEEEECQAGGAGGASSAVRTGERAVLQDYTITGPTLEEVFMNVAREAGATGGV